MSNNPEILELYKQFQAAQDKYTYFLLAAAAASVGFAIQKTDGLLITQWLIPVAISIVCWGASFFCGCKNLIWKQSALYANFNLLQLRVGVHPDQPPHPQLAQAAMSGVESALSKNAGRVEFYAKWQFLLLIWSAVSFIAWRVIEMARATYAA